MSNQLENCQALQFGDADPETFKTCSFLVNVLSYMYEQYEQWKKRHPLQPSESFPWTPEDVCPVTQSFNLSDFRFGNLIWSKFTLTNQEGEKNEPFGCVVTSNIDGAIYLVFRGSKSIRDFLADAEMQHVRYDPPDQNEVRHLFVEKGFYAVYQGMRKSLGEELKKLLPMGKHLAITGHSLGSALATLAVPDAVACGLNVRNYNTASPRVGLDSFVSYYESLPVLETFRIVNTADVVPKLPPVSIGYVHIGVPIEFDADYGSEAKNHNPCCSYAYAIFNPEQPCNPDFITCESESKKSLL